jgi:phage shock protein A
MEPSDLTVRILQEIRDEVRGLRGEMNKRFDAQTASMNERFDAQTARFEVIETALRDFAEQLVVLARGVKALIEQRPRTEDRLEDLERRVAQLEARSAQ